MKTPMSRRLRLAAVGSALALGYASGIAANVPDVTTEESLSHLAAEDLELLQEAVLDALNDPRNSVTVRWRNEANGAAGRAQVVGTFRARDARSCKLLRVVAPDADRLTYTVCRDDSGNWLEASDVRAPRMRG